MKYHISADIDGCDLEILFDLLVDRIHAIQHSVQCWDTDLGSWQHLLCGTPVINNQAERDWYVAHAKYLEALKAKIKVEPLDDEQERSSTSCMIVSSLTKSAI